MKARWRKRAVMGKTHQKEAVPQWGGGSLFTRQGGSPRYSVGMLPHRRDHFCRRAVPQLEQGRKQRVLHQESLPLLTSPDLSYHKNWSKLCPCVGVFQPNQSCQNFTAVLSVPDDSSTILQSSPLIEVVCLSRAQLSSVREVCLDFTPSTQARNPYVSNHPLFPHIFHTE